MVFMVQPEDTPESLLEHVRRNCNPGLYIPDLITPAGDTVDRADPVAAAFWKQWNAAAASEMD